MSTKMIEVRKEFGESFQDVVRGFAEMGYSRRAVADILGFNLSYLRKLCQRYDLHQHFKPQNEMRRECRKTIGGGGGWPKGKSRPYRPIYSNQDLLDEVVRYGGVSTTFVAMSDIALTTVLRRFGSWREARRLAYERLAA